MNPQIFPFSQTNPQINSLNYLQQFLATINSWKANSETFTDKRMTADSTMRPDPQNSSNHSNQILTNNSKIESKMDTNESSPFGSFRTSDSHAASALNLPVSAAGRENKSFTGKPVSHHANCVCQHCGKCFSRPWLLQGTHSHFLR